MTLDALEACIAEKRLGANDKNLGRLKKLSSGDNPYNPVGKPKSPDRRGMGLLESDR